MTKQEKYALAEKLAERIKASPNFYLLDVGGMSVEKTGAFRAKLYAEGFEMTMAKNTLIVKALEKLGIDGKALAPALKQPSSILFAGERINQPAKLVKTFRGPDGEKPAIKAAYIEEGAFVGGPELLDLLVNLKGKNELLGEVVGLLQSPMKNVISGLQASGGHKIAGLVEALSKRQTA